LRTEPLRLRLAVAGRHRNLKAAGDSDSEPPEELEDS
jgi:hypothetical protein